MSMLTLKIDRDGKVFIDVPPSTEPTRIVVENKREHAAKLVFHAKREVRIVREEAVIKGPR